VSKSISKNWVRTLDAEVDELKILNKEPNMISKWGDRVVGVVIEWRR
jgi:hypothetical protein